MNVTTELNKKNALRIANNIVLYDAQTEHLKVDETVNALATLILTLPKVSEIKNGADIEYFDVSGLLKMLERDNFNDAMLTDGYVVELSELRQLMSRFCIQQLEKWQSNLAQCVNVDVSTTIQRLIFLAENGQKVEMIRNHSEFHFLNGYLAAVEEFSLAS